MSGKGVSMDGLVYLVLAISIVSLQGVLQGVGCGDRGTVSFLLFLFRSKILLEEMDCIIQL